MKMNRTEFLARRKSGIGGSDVAAIMGLSKWKTPYQIWQDKTGRAADKPETEYQHFGTVLEQVIADEFSNRHGVKVQRRNEMFRHKEHPELVANIDRYIVGGGILECKTSNAFSLADWGESGTDQIPDYYMTQVQHYMHVTGYHDAVLAVLIGGNTYRDYNIAYDRDLAEFQSAKCMEFWREYVEKDMPPPITLQDDLSAIWRGSPGEVKTADAEMLKKIARYREVAALCKTATDEKDQLAKEIKLFCENAEILVDSSGKPLLTWKCNRDSVSKITDWEKMVRTVLPPDAVTDDLIGQFTVETVKPGARILKLKKVS
jgi:putative phage-type endonuclease